MRRLGGGARRGVAAAAAADGEDEFVVEQGDEEGWVKLKGELDMEGVEAAAGEDDDDDDAPRNTFKTKMEDDNWQPSASLGCVREGLIIGQLG